MTSNTKYFSVMGAIVALITTIGFATPSMAQERVYAITQDGSVVTSGTGLCWRTSNWTPVAAANDPAGCACDKDVLPAAVCNPPVATKAVTVKPTMTNVTIAAETLFDFDKSVLRPAGKAKLDEVVAIASKINLEVILAVGHTDRIGSAAYNKKLSERRAGAVKSYLVSKGIPDNRVHASGMGKLDPRSACGGIIVNRELIDCLQPDRRVEVQVIGTK